MLNRTFASLLLALGVTGSMAVAQELDQPLAGHPEVTIADLLPPADQFQPTNVAVMTNDAASGLQMTLEFQDVNAPAAAMTVPFMLAQRYTSMTRIMLDNPNRLATDAQTAAELGLPDGLPCVGSVKGGILYCLAGETATLQVGSGGLIPMDTVLAIANALPFDLYRQVFAE